jgi:uncharacterized delta-60 repeat protein
MKSLLILLVLVNCIYISKAQPGTLDPHFGNQGKVITYFDGLFVDIRASALQSNGKIICVGGYTSLEPSGGFIVIRYTQDGILDSSFGDNGKILTHFGYDYEIATGVSISPSNEIIVGGYGSKGFVTAKYDVLLSKYKMDGVLDSSFGVNGHVFEDFGQDEFIYSTKLQANGKIVLSGNSAQDLIIARFNNNGQVDQTFGTNGITITDFSDREFGRSSVIQKDGKIIVAGFKNLSHPQFCLARYMPNGLLDPSFGSQGKVVTNLSDGDERIYSIALQNDEKIIVGGESGVRYSDHNYGNSTILRYNTDGKVDEFFGENGRSISQFQDATSVFQSLLIRSDDNIVALGINNQYDVNNSDFVITAFTERGMIDSSFGMLGKVVTDFGGYESNAIGLLKSDGKVVLCGLSRDFENPVYKIVLSRYFGKPFEQYLRIKHWLHHHGITWEDKPNNLINYYSIQSSTNGNAFTEVARIFSNHHGGIQTYSAANNATANYRVAAISNTGNIAYSNTLTLTATPTIQLYPNPAKNILQIQGLPAGTNKLTVTDITGNTRLIATTNSTVYSINIAQLTSGNYLLHIKTANEVITKQFIKE